jgi:hypothetical protein
LRAGRRCHPEAAEFHAEGGELPTKDLCNFAGATDAAGAPFLASFARSGNPQAPSPWDFDFKETIDPKIKKGMLASMRRAEKQYGKKRLRNYYHNDFEWGMLNGKLSALRWVLGDEWDMLDT